MIEKIELTLTRRHLAKFFNFVLLVILIKFLGLKIIHRKCGHEAECRLHFLRLINATLQA